MTPTDQTHGDTVQRLRTLQRNFARDEDGMITIFACFMILIMLMVGGIGVDLMRHEMERMRLQSVSDRAALAAADLDQTLTPSEVVRDYFSKAGMADYVSNVEVSDGLNYRTVSVDATNPMKTHFMKMTGVDTLNVPVHAKAEEKIQKVEISMVLDISGSMNSNSKMWNLRNAAKEFIDTVLTPENEGLISVSLVPYSEQVNAGPAIVSQLNVNMKHEYSYCLEFPDSSFQTARLDTGLRYDQMQHFQWNYYSIESGYTRNTLYDTICPRNWYEEIAAFSEDKAALKNRIDRLQPRAGTAIYLGMKWATAMLDPSFRPVNSAMASVGASDPEFAARPASYDDAETLKTVILMTDGQNSNTIRISDWYYDDDSEVVHWNRYNLNYYLERHVSSWYRSNFYYQKYSASQGDSMLSSVCDAAKENRIVIWSIGFEVTTHGANVMRDCASSPSHFFRVEGVEISDAFEAIARQINQLRLTQ